MNREEARDRTERHEWPDAERGEERFQQDGAAGRYDGGVLEELEAHRFFHPPSVRWHRPRPVIDCQFIGAAYDEGPPERHWTDRIVVEDNLLQAWLIVAERYMRRAERPFSIDMRTLRRDDHPPGYASFREAFVNQLIHQDYGDCGRTAFIRFFATGRCSGTRGTATRPEASFAGST